MRNSHIDVYASLSFFVLFYPDFRHNKYQIELPFPANDLWTDLLQIYIPIRAFLKYNLSIIKSNLHIFKWSNDYYTKHLKSITDP